MTDGETAGKIASFYRRFAAMEARGSSALYEELACGVAGDAEILDLLSGLPASKVQPNLLFAATRFVAGTPVGFDEFREQVRSNRAAVVETMMARYTQTNEVARTAHVVPILSSLPQPLALIEVGASAGLNLLCDRYRYDYGYATTGDPDSALTIECEVDGPIRPALGQVEIAWRAGLDRNPLDVTSEADMQWLETLVWPEHQARLDRLRAAVRIGRTDPPRIVSGDLLDDIDALIAEAPRDATLAVMHSSTLVYVPRPVRSAFATKMLAMDGHWISQEGLGVAPGLGDAAEAPVNIQPPHSRATLTVSVNGSPKALAAPHGGWIHWLTT